MNTRIATFAICLLSLIFFTSAMLSKQHDLRTPITTHVTETKTDSKNQDKDAAVPLNLPWSEDNKHVQHSNNHSSDDDGQVQHFHFNRINRVKRGRRFFLLLAKLVLLIVHLTSFFSSFYPFMH